MKKAIITFIALFISVIAFGQSKNYYLYDLNGSIIESGTIQESLHDEDTLTMHNIEKSGTYFLRVVQPEGEYVTMTWMFVAKDEDHIEVTGGDHISPQRIILCGKPIYLQRKSKSNDDEN